MIDLDTLARKASKAAVLPLGLARGRRHGDVVILLYHRVGPGPEEIELSPTLFERQMRALARRDRVLPLGTALGDEQRGGVVVTFDDGYRDFYETALPILVRHHVPAILYLATSFVDNTGSELAGPPLSWSQLEEIVSSGLVTIGAHTHSHADLSSATEGEAEAEMRRSQELIEDRLGIACRHFAYPWGVGSPEADRAARRLFDTAAFSVWRTNRRGRIDNHRLGRVPILRSDGMAFFHAKARGKLNGEAMIYRALGKGPWSRGSRG
jgi:peptidoglycan/xylan/chitin deacetylase (PgdA/CDA1 family)